MTIPRIYDNSIIVIIVYYSYYYTYILYIIYILYTHNLSLCVKMWDTTKLCLCFVALSLFPMLRCHGDALRW